MPFRSVLFVLVVGSVSCGPAPAEEKPKAAYADLLEKVKSQDPKADFAALRMAYTETPAYNPYDFEQRDNQQAMRAAMKKKEYEKAVEYVEKVLAKNYLDIEAHYIAARALTELKKEDRAKYHRWVANGLVESILKSGDGKTPATAYKVITTTEEYAVFGVLGIEPGRQALITDKGIKYDQMTGTHRETNKEVTFYFDISKPLGWLEKNFKKDR
jgi:hypothetical protein